MTRCIQLDILFIMKLEQRLIPSLQQKLILTPQLKQALHILQLPLLDLRTLIETELVENPLLEEEQVKNNSEETVSENRLSSLEEIEEVNTRKEWEERLSNFSHSIQIEEDEKKAFAENSLREVSTLQDHLLWQLKLSVETEEEQRIGEAIIGNIDENGYLKTTISEISKNLGVDEKKVSNILAIIQEFEPTGVGARDLKESLLIQLKALGKENSLAVKLIRDYLPEIEKKKWQEIARRMHLPVSKIRKEANFISTLEPKPGRKFSTFSPQAVIPDVIVKKVGEDYQAFLNTEYIPRLRLNPRYRDIIQRSKDASTRKFVEKKLRAARWIINNINQRQQTIIKVAEAIIRHQREFIEKGIEYLRPCTLEEIAEKTGLHTSTVSRAISQKYVDTPRGVFEFKIFFSKGLEQEKTSAKSLAPGTIKAKIETLIENEDVSHPLSDEEIKEALSRQGISISRRTVTKYREALGILPSNLRKK